MGKGMMCSPVVVGGRVGEQGRQPGTACRPSTPDQQMVMRLVPGTTGQCGPGGRGWAQDTGHRDQGQEPGLDAAIGKSGAVTVGLLPALHIELHAQQPDLWTCLYCIRAGVTGSQNQGRGWMEGNRLQKLLGHGDLTDLIKK